MMNSQKGFTLVELLAVIIVFSVVTSIIAGILVTSLRTSNKTNIISTVKQNGNFALTQMSGVIRNARVLVSPYPCGSPSTPTTVTQLQLITADGLPITLDCNAQVSNTPPTCTPQTPCATIASNSASLLDTSAIKLTACTFTCSQLSNTDYPIINISFSLKQITNSNFADQVVLPNSGTVNFYTSIVLRNLQR